MQSLPRFVDELVREHAFTFVVKGSCMRPHLLSGQRARVNPARFYWVGDILVVRNRLDQLMVHRAIGIYRRRGRWMIVTKADDARLPDSAVPFERVLGVVSSADGMPLSIPATERVRALWAFVRYGIRYLSRRLWTSMPFG